jgi:ABC-2 type transport system permease protein
MNKRRIWGVILRHLYNFRHSADRLVDSFYWPAVDLVLWGITTRYFLSRETNGVGGLGGVGMGSKELFLLILLSGVVFWQIIWRGANEFTTGLLEEMWNRNLMPLFASPLTLSEWIFALFILSFIKMLMTVVFCIILAYILYSVNVLSIDFLLIPFVASLIMMGWWVGIFISAIIIRFGQRIQTLAWSGAVVLMPFCAIFYPVSSLPDWARAISRFVPGSYIFEGMRTYLTTKQIPMFDLGMSFLLNFVYLFLSLWFFKRMFEKSREMGLGRLE